MLASGLLVYIFLFKIVSFLQSRLGPMEAGPYGSLQLVAEVGRFLQKEDIVPDQADRRVFKMAPYIVMITAMLLFVAIPAGPDAFGVPLDTGIYFVLAVSSISVLGVLMAGWSSGSKYSLIGGLRATGQLIAYELPLVLAVVGVVIQAGGLSFSRHRRCTGRRQHLRVGCARQPLHPHAIHRARSSSWWRCRPS